MVSKAEKTLFLSPEFTKKQRVFSTGSDKQSFSISFYFDLHNVLFDQPKNAIPKNAFKIKNKPKFVAQALRASVSRTFWKNVKKLRKQNIKVTEAYITPLKKYSTLHNGLLNFMNGIYTPNKQMENYTKQLKQQGHHLFLLSNIGPELLNDLQKQHPTFFDHFDRKQNTINYNAHQTNTWFSKPHVASYQHALTLTNRHTQPWLCVFVDDKLENINGALQAGLNGILFVNPDQFQKDVEFLFTYLQSIGA